MGQAAWPCPVSPNYDYQDLTMTSNEELKHLIRRAESHGAVVDTTLCSQGEREGRQIINSVTIIGLKGCGMHEMPALSAAEVLRSVLPPEQPLKFTRPELADRLDQIAQGITFDETALREAMLVACIPQSSRFACRRYITATQIDMDHIRLQELAIALRAPRTLSFNTGREYAPEGQRIEAQLVNMSFCELLEEDLYVVEVQDLSRGIKGRVQISRFNQEAIMKAYDAGHYSNI